VNGPVLHARPALLAAVAAGGLVGAPLRALVDRALTAPGAVWPTGTLVVNLTGALALGALLEALVRLGPDAGWRRAARLGLGTGLLGAFTTYSALVLQVLDLLREGRTATAVAYAATSVLGGLLAAAAGVALASRAGRRRTAERSGGTPGGRPAGAA